MAKDRNGSIQEGTQEEEEKEKEKSSKRKSRRRKEESSSEESSTDSDDDRPRRSKKRKRRRRSSRRSSTSESGSDSESDSESEESLDESESEARGSEEGSEDEVRRKKRKERKRRRREEERERRRRKEKRKRIEKEERRRKKDKDKKKKKKKKKEKDGGKKGAVTNSWGKYGILRETDMWNKRPEFTAWLSEVKQVNLETLPNWEEKQMFKEFMEDHNTATFPSKKYYNLDAYHHRKMEKEMKKGLKKVANTERTVFNDEEQRRLELMRARERQKEEQVEALKCSMQSGMAQAMKEQARLKEEMAYQYRLGNFEAAAAIQKRLDPDVAM